MRLLYTLSIRLYHLFIQLAALFNEKARKWISGRKKQAKLLETVIEKKSKRVWIHCASLGEFEQARPLIDQFKLKHQFEVILTFFSPSGYEIRSNYEHADHVFYLPIDTSKKAIKFIQNIQPDLAVFIKYEFWFNYLLQLSKSGIPCFLVSGIFRKKQHFFKWYGKWFAHQLTHFQHFFIQNSVSAKLLESIGYNNYTVSGDTRFDQVQKLSAEPFSDAIIDTFLDREKAVIFGSSWPHEEMLAKELIDTDPHLKIIIAPHEVNDSKRKYLDKLFGEKAIFHSKGKVSSKKENVLIIDSIGLLSKLYRYGKIAIIGGGFGKGIHNTLEAAIYGCPTIFGPNYKKFKEAKDLINCGAAFSKKNAGDIIIQIQNLLNDPKMLSESSKAANQYCAQHIGATDVFFNYLQNVQLLSKS